MNEAGIRMALHLTARTTFVFFVCAFTGNALRDLWPGRFSLWLAMQRDWFLIAIIAFFQVVGWSKLRLVTLLGGGFVYLLIYALAVDAMLRSRNREQGFLGSPRFETIALYLIWAIFALAFVPRIVSGWPAYSLLGTAALAALFIRIACLVRHRRAKAAAA
jgi:hypothetical protein